MLTATPADVLAGRARWCVVEGDCLDVLPTLGRVDAVVTDPPYGVGFSGKRAKQRGGGVAYRPGGYDFDDSPEYIAETVVPAVQMCISLASSVAVTPGTRSMWLYPRPDDIGCFFSAAATGMGRWGFSCMQPILYYGSDPYLARRLGSRANSCGQTYPNDANETGHPCAKPLPMMLWLVARASLEDGVVLDPFAGSGTTGVAALRLGRRAIMIERAPGFAALCRERLETEERGSTLAAARAGQRPLFGAGT